MINSIKKLLQSRSQSTIRWTLFLFTFGIVILRFFNESIRARIDILNFVLLCVAILAVLREDVKYLISRMNGVGFIVKRYKRLNKKKNTTTEEGELTKHIKH